VQIPGEPTRASKPNLLHMKQCCERVLRRNICCTSWEKRHFPSPGKPPCPIRSFEPTFRTGSIPFISPAPPKLVTLRGVLVRSPFFLLNPKEWIPGVQRSVTTVHYGNLCNSRLARFYRSLRFPSWNAKPQKRKG